MGVTPIGVCDWSLLGSPVRETCGFWLGAAGFPVQFLLAVCSCAGLPWRVA